MEIATKSKKEEERYSFISPYILLWAFFLLNHLERIAQCDFLLGHKRYLSFPATKVKKISLLASFSFSISKHHWWTWLWFSVRCKQHQKKDNIEIGKKNWNQRFLTNPCKLTHFLQTSVSAWVLGITS